MSVADHQEKKKCDEENKLKVVLENVAANSSANSEHEDIRRLRAALDKGDQLKGRILSGGYTNYSYQLYLENNPDFRLFAKLCFAYANWCPGVERPHYDLERQTVEFNLMQRFSQEMGGPGRAPVATPYLLLDVSDEMRILVTQWAPADEQFANQFIEGHIDKRVLPQLAKAFATITLTEVDDPNMNSTMKQNLNDMLVKPFDDEFEKHYQKPRDHDACISYLHEIGKERFDALMTSWRLAEARKQCMVHSDSHVFNILVEGKSDATAFETFGENGIFVMCDWEMSHVGAFGKDVGLFYTFPLACAYYHAAQGNDNSCNAILEGLETVWQEYSKCLREGGKNEDVIIETYRNILGFCGWFVFAPFYTLHQLVEFADTSGLSPEESESILAQLGATALKMMQWAWADDAPAAHFSLSDLKALFTTTVHEDIKAIVEQRDLNTLKTTQQPQRRSSVLRANNRRISDAGMIEATLNRLSLLEYAET